MPNKMNKKKINNKFNICLIKKTYKKVLFNHHNLLISHPYKYQEIAIECSSELYRLKEILERVRNRVELEILTI